MNADARTEHPTDDILNVAAVVTGEKQLPLRGWQKHDALTAMCALGYSKDHIAWALCTTRASVENYGYRNGIPMHRHDQRPDWTAIRWVTHHGARMRLLGVDRDEAVRALAARGHHLHDIRERLRCSDTAVKEAAQRLGVTIPDAPEPAGWNAYVRRTYRRQAVAA